MYTNSRVPTAGGAIDVRRTGRGPTLLAVHGMMVNSHVWDPIVAGLRDHLHLVLPDLPLGGHRLALDPDADCGLAAHAERVIALARTLPRPIVLMGSDTGGAICQLAVVREPELFDRLVLLPSDAFGNCPPRLLSPLPYLSRLPGIGAVLGLALRADPVKRALMLLVSRTRTPADLLGELLGALPTDAGVQRDLVKLLRGLRPEVTRTVAGELHRFAGEVLIVWSRSDPLFPLDHARRLAGCFPRSSVVIAEHSRAFVALDEPDWLARRIAPFGTGARPDHD